VVDALVWLPVACGRDDGITGWKMASAALAFEQAAGVSPHEHVMQVACGVRWSCMPVLPDFQIKSISCASSGSMSAPPRATTDG